MPVGLIETPARQAATLRETGHRPWPLPPRSWVQGQTWERLLFAHWRVEVEEVRRLVPEGLEVDVHDGSAWLGVTPFLVSGFRLRGTLPLPVVSTFLEVNARTYVSRAGRPGIWFFSLDASSRLAVEAARLTYRLPYHRARISLEADGAWTRFSCSRLGAERPYVFEGRYRGTGARPHAGPGTLEHFLTERYRLYAVDGRGRIAAADIHHPPWPLEAAEAELDVVTMAPTGLSPGHGPLLHYAERQDVVIWPLEPVE